MLTPSAQEFIGAITFEALTGRPVHTALIAAGHALDHIKLARAAHVFVVAPATADFLARAAMGRGDDLLTTALLATPAPVLIVPAMNDQMWAHPQVATNAAHLRQIGYHVLEPDTGDLAVGEGRGPGRMPEPETILAHVGRLLEQRGMLAGKKVVVTAGATREAIDPVRFISNRSSGKMGVALAEAAWRRGAQVTLVAGAVSTSIPSTLVVRHVETTEQMCDAVRDELADADVLVMAAAPSDFRPATVANSKIKKGSAGPAIQLEATPDILASTISARRAHAVVVGFALETDDLLANANAKLHAKRLDLIVANNAREEGAGFEVDTNRVTLIAADSANEELPLLSKRDVSDRILDRVESILRGR